MNTGFYCPSFCGYKSEFSRKFEEYIARPIKSNVEEQNLVDSFKTVVRENMTPDNEKGRGFQGIVYGIDDDYVFKVDKSNGPRIGDNIQILTNNFLKDLKTYFGTVIAKIGDVEIMKNAFKSKEPIPAGLPNVRMTPQGYRDYYNNVYLKRFSDIPQTSYDRVAEDFKVLNKAGKEFDTINPNNFTADGDDIKIIDKITDATEPRSNNLAKLFRVFTNSYDASTAAEFDIGAVKNRKEVFRKLILASERAELPYGSSPKDRKELDLAMELCDYKEGFSEIQRTLMDYRRKYPDMEVRLQKVAEFLKEFDEPDMYTVMFYS